MIGHLVYRGWVGSIEFSEEDAVFHGQLLGTKDLISYEGESVASLTQDFHDATDEYIDLCLRHGKFVPQQEGVPNVPLRLELYRQVAEVTRNTSELLDDFVNESVRLRLEKLAS